MRLFQIWSARCQALRRRMHGSIVQLKNLLLDQIQRRKTYLLQQLKALALRFLGPVAAAARRYIPSPRKLSGKLTLFSLAMVLTMWFAVGIVLVLNTAREIMDSSMDLAQAQAEKYSHDSYLQTYYTSRKTGFDRWWMENGCDMQIDFLFPQTNQDTRSRYLQYNLSTQLTTTVEDWDFTPLPPRTLIGIRAMTPESGVETGTFLSLEQFSAQQLWEIGQALRSTPNALPLLTATGTRDGKTFLVDMLRLDGTTYHAHNLPDGRKYKDTITLTGSEEPSHSYALFPTCVNTLNEWERLLEAQDYILGGYRETKNTIFRCFAQSLTTLYQSGEMLDVSSGEEPELIYLHVVVLSTPLKTALEENTPVLLQLLILVPVLGLLFSEVIRRMVVLPLQTTQEDFQKVARLDFTGLSGDEKRKDEIGELNRSLRNMSGELQRRWDDERALEGRRREFVAAASHELKTPLALMRGYTEGLIQNIGDREEYLANMEREIDRMNALVLEMLEQTRLEGMEDLAQTQTVDLTALVGRLLTEMAPLFQGLQCSAHLVQGVTCPGNPQLLERGIGNLLSNAARYCTPGGQVRLELRNGPVLTVENDADPIPEEELPRLFEMFYRGDKARDRSGSGMGLAIARRIFSLHHFRCTAELIPDGVRFTLAPDLGENP